MKTEKVIDLLKFWRDNCDLTIRHNGNLVDCKILLRNAAEKLRKNDVAINNQKHEIDALKKHVAELKKELSEREAGQRWISVEERMPEEEGKIYFILFADENQPMVSYFGCGRFTHENVAYWMPIPETPKKVKTYTDVFLERMKEAFPELDVNHVKPAYCRAQVFSEEVDCDGIHGDCKACWNQPYPEEEGGAE